MSSFEVVVVVMVWFWWGYWVGVEFNCGEAALDFTPRYQRPRKVQATTVITEAGDYRRPEGLRGVSTRPANHRVTALLSYKRDNTELLKAISAYISKQVFNGTCTISARKMSGVVQ